MNRLGKHLAEARKRAGLTQLKLGEKINIDDSYISRVERGVYPPPSREVVLSLVDVLGMSNEPVTLYVPVKDQPALERFSFCLEANVASSEDVQEIKLFEVEDKPP